MTRFLRRFRSVSRLTAWLLVVCLVSSLAAPALHAQTSTKATVDNLGDGSDASDEASTTSVQDDDEVRDEARASEDEEDEDEDEDDNPSRYSRIPRSDRTQLNRTLTSVLGGLGLGVLGMAAFGMVGFAVAGALGAAVGYWVSTELWPDHASNSPGYDTYDVYYGQGANTYPIRINTYSTDPGTNLRSLEETYFAALEEYRRTLRSGDVEASGVARQAYTEAYQAYLMGKRAGY